MSEEFIKAAFLEQEAKIAAMLNDQLEKIKTAVVAIGVIRESVVEITSTKPKTTTRVLKGNEIPHDPITKIIIKDIGKIKNVSDFLVAIGKTKNFGEEFYKGIVASLEMLETDEELIKFDTVRNKESRISSKIKHLYDTKLKESPEHSAEINSIFETYKKNAAMNVHILPTIYSIGCNQAMIDEVENGKLNGVMYAEQEIIPDIPDDTKEKEIDALNILLRADNIKQEEPPKINLLSLLGKKEEVKVEEVKVEEVKKEEVKKEEVKVEEVKKEEAKVEEVKKEEVKIEEVKKEPPKINLLNLLGKKEEPKQVNLLNLLGKEEVKPDLLNLIKKTESKAEEVKPEQPKVEEVKTESKAEEVKTEQPKVEEVKPAEVPIATTLIETGAKMGIQMDAIKPQSTSAMSLLSLLIKK